ncbi:hypothetical protein PIB30_007334 [Stylosanthes scabra]|uniref:Uncharacterized protein n=1 Tax=Stylosanthes scabra TaxID=79078 RepID=A0ABU6Y668_9FABA|nr:hypothetical protein [Stylosanthes scabra]
MEEDENTLTTCNECKKHLVSFLDCLGVFRNHYELKIRELPKLLTGKEHGVFLFEGFQQKKPFIYVTTLRPCVLLMAGTSGVPVPGVTISRVPTEIVDGVEGMITMEEPPR